MSVRISDAAPDRRSSARVDNEVVRAVFRRYTAVLRPYRDGHRHVWRYPFDFATLRVRT